MSLLVQQPLSSTPVSQRARIARSINVAAIRPWIYVEGSPDGILRMEILQDDVLLATNDIPCSQIVAAKLDLYVHGWLRFSFESLQLNVPEDQVNTEYEIRLSLVSNTTGLIAWNREWDFPKYENYGALNDDGDPVNDMIAPYGYELYVWENY